MSSNPVRTFSCVGQKPHRAQPASLTLTATYRGTAIAQGEDSTQNIAHRGCVLYHLVQLKAACHVAKLSLEQEQEALSRLGRWLQSVLDAAAKGADDDVPAEIGAFLGMVAGSGASDADVSPRPTESSFTEGEGLRDAGRDAAASAADGGRPRRPTNGDLPTRPAPAPTDFLAMSRRQRIMSGSAAPSAPSSSARISASSSASTSTASRDVIPMLASEQAVRGTSRHPNRARRAISPAAHAIGAHSRSDGRAACGTVVPAGRSSGSVAARGSAVSNPPRQEIEAGRC